MTRTYYHATDYQNLESILTTGLKRGYDGLVYLTDTAEDALKFLMLRFYERIAVFAVDLEEDLVDESFDHSERFFKCKAYTYSEDIAPHDFSDVSVYEFKIGE